MITITILKNPFNHTEKEIHTCEHVPGKTAYEYIQPYIMGLEEYVVSRNGAEVETASLQILEQDDWLAVCPVVGKSGSDWFRAIGMIALTVWTGNLAVQWGNTFWAQMAASGIRSLGGMLLNHWFPMAQPDRQTYQITPSYSWGNAQAPTDQGNALAVTYGSMRTAGQILAKHVSSDGEKQYMNLLLCGGEGPVDNISDIRINDNPIAYYKGVTVETRLGSNDQTVIANFNDTYDDQGLAYELNTDTWIAQQTEVSAAEGLEITIELPYGLYCANNEGGLDSASVTLQAQYHKIGDTNWKNFTDNNSTNLTISAAQNTSFSRTYRVDNLPAAQYEVRVRCTAKSGTASPYSTNVYWTRLSSILNDGTYRNQVLAYELDTGNVWTTQQIEGNAVEGLEITIELPYGLYCANNEGGLDSASVTLQAQYHKIGDANWENFTDNNSTNLTISAAQNTSFSRTYRVDNLPDAQYEVRVRCTAKSGTASPYSTNVYWTRLSSILHDGTYRNQVLAYELDTGNVWTTQQIEGNAMEGLEITIELPYGLYYANDKGGLSNASVTLQAQYHKVGDRDWKNFTNGDNTNLTISGAKNTSFFRTYRVDQLPASQYEVRVRCTAKSGTNSRYSTRVYWTQLSSILYDDFARPGKVLIGVKALATNQLSGGMPSITWVQTRSNVWVWNPDSGQYEQKPATNPAWAAYDMIHRCRQIKNIHTGAAEFLVQGTPAARAVYHDFAAWAAFCDARGLAFNYIFNTAADLWTALQKPEGVGRGKVIMRGTKFGCVCDAPGEPVQLFTVGNMITDKFKETFMGIKDRANAIEVTFVNQDKAYQKEIITAYADDYDGLREPNITQITLDGATTTEQAYREAKYRLRLNQYLQRTVEHSADIDAIACQVNDVVLLAHDVPQWGYSGRLLGATATTLTLDRQVTLIPGKTYAVALQITNPTAETAQATQTIVTVDVKGIAEETTTNTVTLATALANVPQELDMYSFGETNKVVKPFRVLSISRDQDLRRKISCIEYIEEVYSEATDIPEVTYSGLDATPEVSSISVAEETYQQKDGTVVSNLHVAWNIARDKLVSGYKILYSSDNGQTWNEWANRMTELGTSIAGVKTQTTYLIKVCTINSAGMVSNGVVAPPFVVIGKDAPPSNINSLAAAIDLTDSTKVILSWPAVVDIDLRGYRVMEGGTVLTPTPISDTRYFYTATESRQYNFSVVAVDNSGNPSTIPADATINVVVEPAQVTGFAAVIQETDRSKLLFSWQPNSETDISYYELRTGNSGWDTAAIVATQLKATAFSYQLLAEGNQTVMVKAVNAAGKASVNPASENLQIILRPDAPTGLSVDQEPTNRAIARLSWTAPAGKDIDGYQIAVNGESYFTRELAYRYPVPDSGTYNFVVKTKTVAGYYSAAANISITAMIEPDDVTGFTATQSLSDRTKVTLFWDNPLSQDVAYFIIKKGANWDNGTVITSRATGTFYDVIVTNETAQTFWIKAVSTAGKESLYPASVPGTFNLNPDPVSNIQIMQQPNDKSVIEISWTGISESDLVGYQVVVGFTWESGTWLPLTQELKTTYSPADTGNIKVMIKAKNAAGYYSDEVFASAYVTLEPEDVTGLVAYQNGETVELYWNQASEPDVTAYEVREGANFDQGALIATGVTQAQYAVKIDAERVYQYFVKAINRSGHYSQAAAMFAIQAANLPVRNVIEEFDEITLQSGTHTNTEFGPSLINWQTIGGKWPDYPTTKFTDIGGKTVLKLKKNTDGTYPTSGTYTVQQIEMGQVITANITAQFVSTVILRGTGSAILQIRTSQSGTVWTDWTTFKPVQYTFRYAEFRVFLGTADVLKTPEVNQFTIRIDVPDYDIAKTAIIAAGGTTVSYGHTYYTMPVVTPTAVGEGLYAQLVSKTVSNCVIKVKNASNADVGGSVDIRIKGY